MFEVIGLDIAVLVQNFNDDQSKERKMDETQTTTYHYYLPRK